MKPLPERITGTFAEIDLQYERWYTEPQTGLHNARKYQNQLVILLGEMAQVIKAARKRELGSHVVRRWKQSQIYLDKKSTGVTSKEAEEESRKQVQEEFLEEIETDANFEGLRILHGALTEKIRFCQDIANDIKHFDKMASTFAS